MKNYAIILFSCCILILAGGLVSGENESLSTNQTILNQTPEPTLIPITPEEELMNLAFIAREFALENGKDSAIAEFSNPNGRFYLNGTGIRAYGVDGTLLADPFSPSNAGTLLISDDYDSGNIRLMRDLATTGGGLFTDPVTKECWFVMDIDGSWWISASRIIPQAQ